MSIFSYVILYFAFIALIVLSSYVINYTYFKEPLKLILRRRKAYLLKEQAVKEYRLWILCQKSYKSVEKEDNRKILIKKFNCDLANIEIELDEIADYLEEKED